jgi:trans-aconitate 2-methyltransferase
MTGDAWNPTQYGRFAAERARPAEDLLALVRPVPGGRVVDLGCGTGELTLRLHERTGAATTLGLDSSPAMLERARAHETGPESGHETGAVRFELGGIEDFDAVGAYDVVFSNAALHWVPDHAALLARLRDALRPGGQLAAQVPANTDHPSHALAFEVAAEPPFGLPVEEATPVLAPERYATLLDELGFEDVHVRLQVYGHHLGSTAEVVEWTKGTTLTRFERELTPERYAEFVDRYRERVLSVLGDHSPYFYTFKRLLFWGKLPDDTTAGETP